ncbi:MAG TPA: thioredoxin-like domain-containing protein [Bryobacteraceae bacterium]|nr:thioredoxin-like domain-containing protein [Bryobacteraceae bacterium]
MKHGIAVVVVMACGLSVRAQTLSQDEQIDLQRALSEGGNSATEYALAIENHLKKYPNSPKRADLERLLVKTAMDLNDDRRLLEYGESVLSRDPNNVQLLEHITTALLHQGDKTHAERALEHARHLADLIQAQYQNEKFPPGGGPAEVKRKDDFDLGRARALVLEARADGLLGHTAEAIQQAEASYSVYASVEAAREASRWLTVTGKDQEALEYLADAFSIAAMHSADPQVASDRARLSQLYGKLHGSDAGLGDLILKSFDDTAFAQAARRAELRALDPNSQTKDPMKFTLSGLDGEKLPLSSLLGKIVVLDFWATWCGPCRTQHPLYEQVETKFKDSGDVVFLAVDTDEDHSLVKPFLDQIKWNNKVYFEDGLQSLLQVSSIPTTIILNRKGEVFTRMVGFLPDRFVDMLSDRVNEALGNPIQSTVPKPVPVPQPVRAPSGQLSPASHQ